MFNFDFTEWMICNQCKAQWFIPEDFEDAPQECPFCESGGDIKRMAWRYD